MQLDRLRRDERELRSGSAQATWSVLRGLVFVVGGLSGLLFAMSANSYPGGAPAILVDLELIILLGLSVGAIVCWIFAVRGRAGDLWTLCYALAWAGLIAITILATLIF